MSIPYGTAWDNTIAVALPYGARTMQGAAAGSIGVCIPFVIFMCVMFQFMYAEHFVKQVSYSFPKRPPSTACVFVNIMLPFQGSARCGQRPVFNTRRSNSDWPAQYCHPQPRRVHRSALQVPKATQHVFPQCPHRLPCDTSESRAKTPCSWRRSWCQTSHDRHSALVGRGTISRAGAAALRRTCGSASTWPYIAARAPARRTSTPSPAATTSWRRRRSTSPSARGA